jgi:hypothetical protein
MDTTHILIPVSSEDGRHAGYKKKASKMRQYLKLKTFDTVKAFWEDYNIKDLEEYCNIIRTSISRPSIMIKRQMMELWTNTFHPWLANVLSNITVTEEQYMLVTCFSFEHTLYRWPELL